MAKSSQAARNVADRRPMRQHLRYGSRGGSETTSLTPEALRRHNQLAFPQPEVA